MGKVTTVKCRYKYCSHENREIPREEAECVGKAYYHKDCLKESREKKEIVDLFLNKINPNSPPPQLWRTVNSLVNTKGYSSDYVLFGLKYYIRNKIPLNYPAGLYYVVSNKDVEAEYNKATFVKPKIEILEDNKPVFEYKKPKRKTLDNLLG